MLDDLIWFTAGKAVCETFPVDSTHHRFNRYILIDYTKKGKAGGQKARKKRWVANTCKHHALISPDGMVLASIVTDKDTADSTIFAKHCAKLPRRGIALGDDTYRSSDNCEAAVAAGRYTFFEPKNHTGKGTDAWAEMVKFWKEHPGRLYAVCKTTIEAAFSAILRARSVTACRNVNLQSSQYAAIQGPDGPHGVKITGTPQTCVGGCAPPYYHARAGQFWPIFTSQTA